MEGVPGSRKPATFTRRRGSGLRSSARRRRFARSGTGVNPAKGRQKRTIVEFRPEENAGSGSRVASGSGRGVVKRSARRSREGPAVDVSSGARSLTIGLHGVCPACLVVGSSFSRSASDPSFERRSGAVTRAGALLATRWARRGAGSRFIARASASQKPTNSWWIQGEHETSRLFGDRRGYRHGGELRAFLDECCAVAGQRRGTSEIEVGVEELFPAREGAER